MTEINRRKFIKTGLALGMAGIGGSLIPGFNAIEVLPALAAGPADLSIVTGKDYYTATIKAVDGLGSMNRFVSRQDKVGLLVNSPFKNYGAYVKPEIFLAVAKMCYEAGAKEISCIKEEASGYWEKIKLTKQQKDLVRSFKKGWEQSVEVEVPGGLNLKEATVRKDFLECDKLINVAITKNHSGVHFSCMLKNMMGAATTMTNLGMHMGGKLGVSMYPDPDYLEQCIVDLNRLKNPVLCVSDSTEFLAENGPSGPGKLLKPQQVVAGTDRVLVDAYCSSLLGLSVEKVGMIQKAAKQGMGRSNWQKANIEKVEI